jgi:hypothetical protein
MMTRKDFEAIAAAVTKARKFPLIVESEDRQAVVDVVAAMLATTCAESNGRFDEDRFLQACGVN